ncbi:MAG: efflux RND transporter periplasmic adaptor subunit [Planctomycetes bacterium]|nr:efflux RND transporter periplasmic adaptor subunit [Planctomycetota bacterium]
MKWAKRGGLIVAGVALLAALVYGFLPKSVESEFASVTRGDIRTTIDEEGRTRVKDRFTIYSPITGELPRIDLKPGDDIKAGDLITVVSPTRALPLGVRERLRAEADVKSAEAQLNRADADVKAATAQAELAKREHKRVRELSKASQVSVEQVDVAATREQAADAALSSALFSRKAAEFQLEMAKASLADDSALEVEGIKIKSPVDGRVLQVLRESEGPVQVNEMLVEIGNPATLEIVADMLSTDAVLVEPGMKVSIERWGGEGALEGAIRLIEPYGFTQTSALGVEEQRVNVVIDITTPREKWSKLGHGYRVEVRVITSERKGVLKVPESAIFNARKGPVVFVVVDGTAKEQPVQLGERNGLEAEVLSALKDGDTVIANPGDDLKDGSSVTQR